MGSELEEGKRKGGGGPRLSASLISNLNKKKCTINQLYTVKDQLQGTGPSTDGTRRQVKSPYKSLCAFIQSVEWSVKMKNIQS